MRYTSSDQDSWFVLRSSSQLPRCAISWARLSRCSLSRTDSLADCRSAVRWRTFACSERVHRTETAGRTSTGVAPSSRYLRIVRRLRLPLS